MDGKAHKRICEMRTKLPARGTFLIFEMFDFLLAAKEKVCKGQADRCARSLGVLKGNF